MPERGWGTPSRGGQGAAVGEIESAVCLSCTSGIIPVSLGSICVSRDDLGAELVKKLVLAAAAVLTLLSITGCTNTGKGKAPPPVVTKG
jgi:hypothetical protein